MAGVLWRAGSSLVLVVVAVVAVAAAAVGPVYLNASGQSVLQSTLRAAPVPNRGLTLVANANGQLPVPRIEAVRAPVPASGPPWFGPKVVTVDVGVGLVAPNGQAYRGDLLARDGDCSHLAFVAGTCPRARGEVALSVRSARALRARVGSTVTPSPANAPRPAKDRLKVVGLYRIPDTNTTYWWEDHSDFTFGLGTNPSQPLPLDALFVTRSTLAPLMRDNPTVTAQVPLRVGAVTTANSSTLVGDLSGLTQSAIAKQDVTVGTELASLVASADHQVSLMATIVAVVTMELVLLTLLLLFGLLARSAEAREGEVALAKLRGFGVLRVLSVGLAQPAALILLAYPLGLALAWGVVAVEAGSLLVPGTPVALPPLSLGTGALAVAGGLLAGLLASRRILTAPLAEQLKSARRPEPSRRAALALDVAALALAAAGIVELAFTGVLQGSHPNPLALFAPALVALGAGVVGARSLPQLCRLGIRPTRASPAVGAFLAVRQVVRRPTLARQVVLLAVALGLTTFALLSWAVARHNRAVRAGVDVGAAQVLTVGVPTLVNLEQAVRRADPSGHLAMAAVVVNTSSTTLLAVDSTRLARVASWPRGLSSEPVAAIAHYLRPRTAPPVTLVGRELALSIDLPHPVPPSLALSLVVAGSNGQAPGITIGPIRAGTHRYTVRLPGMCRRGCHLVTLQPVWQPNSFYGGVVNFSLVLRSLAARPDHGSWRPVHAGLTDPNRWAVANTSPQFGVQAALGEAPARGGLVASFNLEGDQGIPTIGPATTPQALPAVITPPVASVNSDNLSSIPSQGLDGYGVNLNGQVEVPTLPEIEAQGSLVDLTLAQRAATGPELATATDQVWLSPQAGQGVIRRLKAQGLTVLSVRRTSTRLAQLDHGGLALADYLFLVGAAAAAILALGTVIFSLAVSAERRATELTALRAMGVRRRALLYSLLGEQLVLLGGGGALGVAAGLGALTLALPAVPEVADASSGPPLQLGWPAMVLGPFVAVLALLLVVGALVSALGVLRRVAPSRLRVEAE